MSLFYRLLYGRKRILSPENNCRYPLNKDGYVDLSNQFIDCSKLAHKYIKCDFSKSLFAHRNTIYWLENKVFVGSLFSRTAFNAIAEHGNVFQNCTFKDISFRNAILGYDSSRYISCRFENVSFGAFIKPQFKDCYFIDCNFHNVDFMASNFENCVFSGKIEKVWFRGNFPTKSLQKEFGEAKPNKMLNVSFEKAIMHDVTFSDNCDLSTIVLPGHGHYLFFDNWDEQLNAILAEGNKSQTVTTRNDTASFVEIYKVHSANQRYYLLNIEDLINEYSENTIGIIRKNATIETELS